MLISEESRSRRAADRLFAVVDNIYRPASGGPVPALVQRQPYDKAETLAGMSRDGHRPLMVGDGINDAPALAAAFVSMSPASGADVSQAAVDLVFQGERLAPVAETIALARRAARAVVQNFALAFSYNAITIPLAMAGLVSPLVAAIAMSASSLAVVLNALRLGREGSA